MNRKTAAFAAAILLLALAHQSSAQRMSSSNYSAVVIVDEFGGSLNSSSYKLSISATSIAGVSNSTMYRTCVGYLCVLFGPSSGVMSVAFMLDFSVGSGSNIATADTTKSTGLYKPTDLTNYFACVENPSITGNPVVGLIAAGDKLRYIRLDNGTAYTIRVAEDQPGNKFIIPVTEGGCSVVSNKFPLVLPLSPFVPGTEGALGAVELAINYPIDIVGDFEETGKFRLVLEKNDTGIVGRPG